MNMMIQGDPYGILGNNPDQKASIERVALNVLILNTEIHHLKDLKSDNDYKPIPYLEDLNHALKGTAGNAQAGYDALRRAAVYLTCENQLGHRLRDEQFTAVNGILKEKQK